MPGNTYICLCGFVRSAIASEMHRESIWSTKVLANTSTTSLMHFGCVLRLLLHSLRFGLLKGWGIIRLLMCALGAKTRLDQKSTQGALADGPALAGCHAGIRPHSQRHQLQCHHQLLFTRTAYPENLIPLVQGILRVPCIHVVYTLGL